MVLALSGKDPNKTLWERSIPTDKKRFRFGQLNKRGASHCSLSCIVFYSIISVLFSSRVPPAAGENVKNTDHILSLPPPQMRSQRVFNSTRSLRSKAITIDGDLAQEVTWVAPLLFQYFLVSRSHVSPGRAYRLLKELPWVMTIIWFLGIVSMAFIGGMYDV